ncbi:MAG: ATP-binding protein [Actinomycetota bacterium]
MGYGLCEDLRADGKTAVSTRAKLMVGFALIGLTLIGFLVTDIVITSELDDLSKEQSLVADEMAREYALRSAIEGSVISAEVLLQGGVGREEYEAAKQAVRVEFAGYEAAVREAGMNPGLEDKIIVDLRRIEDTYIRLEREMDASVDSYLEGKQREALEALREATVELLSGEISPVLDERISQTYAELIRYRDKSASSRQALAVLPWVFVVFSTALVIATYRITERSISGYEKELEEEIAERKEAQENARQIRTALEKTVEDLARSNRELEQFANVASHDLQEPLRMVASYLQLLEKRYKNALDSDADEFIGYAVDGATRMKAMIDDLLALSRVENRGGEFELVDSEKVLEGVLRDIGLAVEENEAEITHDDLPSVIADEAQLSKLLQNLITNAIRFRGEEAPRVHVSARQEIGEWVFSVADNGIGIDPKYHERIFQIFERLNPRSDVSGTGIGLSITRKIVERHGGRIWVESEPGRGSTFYFTLPERRER